MTTERIDIVVTEKGSEVVERRIKGVGRAAKVAEDSVEFLKKSLATYASLKTLQILQRTVDSYTILQNALKQVTSSSEQLSQVTRELFAISQRTRTSFDSNAESYRRFALAGRDLGITQREVLQFTESLNQAVKISGASTVEASAGILQFSQGLASGALRGDELRSVLEQIPVVADIIAKELGVSRGELQKLGEAGKITSEVIISAFKNSADELKENFGKTVPTLGEGFLLLKNALLLVLGEFNKATSITVVLSGALTFLANNMQTLLKIASVVAIAFGVGFVASFIAATGVVGGLTLAFAALNTVILANPVLIIATLIAGSIAAIVLFREEIWETLRTVKIFGASVAEIFALLADIMIAPIAAAIETIKGLFDDLRIQFFKLADNINGYFRAEVVNPLAMGQPNFERAGRSMAENFGKGYSDYISSGFLEKEFAGGTQKAIKTVNDTLNQKIPGATTGRANVPDEKALKKAEREAEKALKKAQREAERAREEVLKRQENVLISIKGAQVNYNQSVSDFNALLSQGKINGEEFSLAMLRLNKEVLEVDRTLGGGLQRGLLGLQDEFNNLSTLSENTLVNAFNSAEDALVSFVTTGKLNFKGFVDSVLQDIARLIIRQSITAPLLGFISGGLSSAGAAAPVKKFASGGRVSGRGGPTDDLIPTMLSNGEFVINANAAKKFGPLLEMINAGANPTAAGSSGGNLSPIRASSGGQAIFAPTINVTVESSGGGEQSQAQAGGDLISEKISRALEEQFNVFLLRQLRPGALLNEQGTY